MIAFRTNEPVTTGSRSLFGLNKNTVDWSTYFFSGQTLITILLVFEAFPPSGIFRGQLAGPWTRNTPLHLF
jgi:hypothetical protein